MAMKPSRAAAMQNCPFCSGGSVAHEAVRRQKMPISLFTDYERGSRVPLAAFAREALGLRLCSDARESGAHMRHW